MLYKFFNAIKTALLPLGESGISAEWFNNQYEGTILKTPAVYVEFPEAIEPLWISRNQMRADVTVRIHVLSKVLTNVEHTVPDAQVIAHEVMAQGIKAILEGLVLTQTVVVTPATETEPAVTRTDKISEKLQFTRWLHNHKYQGFMVTQIDFVFKTSALTN